MIKKTLCYLLFFVPVCLGHSRHLPENKTIKKPGNIFSRLPGARGSEGPRPEFIVGIGASDFLGELGGANQVGTFFVRDLEFKAIRPSFQLAVRYKFHNRFAIKGGFYYELVSGSDKLTKEPFRNNRNLSFRSNIFELSAQGEFFLTKERIGNKFRLKSARGIKLYDFQAYLFVGIGGFYFNPQAKYNGQWVDLQPLGTEGQGLEGQKAKYSRIAMCIPYGIGIKNAITREFSIGIEAGIRKTFTDYIDDVSTVYYDNAKLRAARGDMAADLADPSLLHFPESLGGNTNAANQTSAGEMRGNPHHTDAYLFVNITASYKIPRRRGARSRF